MVSSQKLCEWPPAIQTLVSSCQHPIACSLITLSMSSLSLSVTSPRTITHAWVITEAPRSSVGTVLLPNYTMTGISGNPQNKGTWEQSGEGRGPFAID
jgi:hypothetical protein